MSEHERRSGFLAGLWALLCLRCPRCRRGRIFKGLLQMNDPCPECGLIFECEEGYFLGAMYVSYAVGCAVVAVAYFVASALWPDTPPLLLCLYLFAGYVPLMPWLFRYSRGIWIHFDRLVCPGDSAAGSYHKMRQSQELRDAVREERP
jgi:uncharacterized protein (DUF983 family)